MRFALYTHRYREGRFKLKVKNYSEHCTNDHSLGYYHRYV